jgi:hypothetical protein
MIRMSRQIDWFDSGKREENRQTSDSQPANRKKMGKYFGVCRREQRSDWQRRIL